jgi:hypothetical protein
MLSRQIIELGPTDYSGRMVPNLCDWLTTAVGRVCGRTPQATRQLADRERPRQLVVVHD